ncbi:MAG: alpha/beta hydrolase [Vicinamibacterales bacterium]
MTVHTAVANDGVRLRLERHRGGPRGPVMLVHCIGVSSGMYTLDSIETNLRDYLVDAGYDVWLLDFRFSIRLPEAVRPHSFDDVARRDYPAAVAAVRDATGRDVQVIAHGVGASTLTMALLAGLQGVKSAVCSQVSTDLVLPAAMKRKADLRLTSVAAAAGIDTMTTTPLDPTCGDQVLDALLRLQPVEREERCTSAVCHRISAMYGELYQHAQLSEATHARLGEEFGVVSVRAFSHLSLLGRVGHLVDEAGAEAYLPRVERLALPILFLHGEKNECVLPEATAITLRRLTEANGASWYSRRLIPDYGHVDCIIGQHASRDVYPHILGHLEATA